MRSSSQIFMIALFLLLFPTTVPIFGHANLVGADPPPYFNLEKPPQSINLRFSETLEPGFSRIIVFDDDGRRVNEQDSFVDEDDDASLVLELPILEEGLYVVSWRTLSAIDGHTADSSFVIGVGNITLPLEQPTEEVSIPPNPVEVIIRWATLAIQTGLVGVSTFALAALSPIFRQMRNQESGNHFALFEKKLSRSLHKAAIYGSLALLLVTLVFVAYQGLNVLGVPILEIPSASYQILTTTQFGQILGLRIFLAAIMFSTLVVLRRYSSSRTPWLIALPLGLILLFMTTISSHTAASEIPIVSLGLISDWSHQLAVSVWIGGLFAFAFSGYKARRSLDSNEMSTFLVRLIPRFSHLALLGLGIVSVSGTYLAWIHLKTISALWTTFYGQSLLLKLVLLAPVVLLGGLNQFVIHSSLVRSLKGQLTKAAATANLITKRFGSSVKIEATLGVGIILIVGVLTSSSPPLGQRALGLVDEPFEPLVVSTQSEGVMIDAKISPFKPGLNQFLFNLTTSDMQPLEDAKSVTLILDYLDQNFGEQVIDLGLPEDGQIEVVGEFLAVAGNWDLTLQISREQGFDAIANFEFDLPSVTERFPPTIFTFDLPIQGSFPYGIVLGDDNRVWFAETSLGRISVFDARVASFDSFRLPNPGSLPTLVTFDSNGLMWITEPQSNSILSFNPADESFVEYPIPTPDSIPQEIIADSAGRVWFTELQGSKIGVFTPADQTFVEIETLTEDAQPLGLTLDSDGNVWFAEFRANRIGFIDVETMTMKEFSPEDIPLNGPTDVAIDRDGLVWVTEHGGNRLTRLDPETESYERILLEHEFATPYGIINGLSDELWFVEHLANRVGKLNTDTLLVEELDVDVEKSDLQWLSSDRDGNVWFSLTGADKIGVVARSFTIEVEGVEEIIFTQNLTLSLILSIAVVIPLVFFYSRKRYNKIAMS